MQHIRTGTPSRASAPVQQFQTMSTQAMAQDLNKHYRLDTLMQALWLPATQAQLALNRKKATEAASNNFQAKVD